MGFLIRIALLLGVGILFIPADEAETKKLGQGQSLSLFDTFGFASAAYSDIGGFCGRNPTACTTGGVLVATFEAKARTGARWIYATLDPAAKSPATDRSATPAVGAETTPSGLQPMPALATGSVRVKTSPVRVSPIGVTSVSIAPRSHGDALPLPPPRRPS